VKRLLSTTDHTPADHHHHHGLLADDDVYLTAIEKTTEWLCFDVLWPFYYFGVFVDNGIDVPNIIGWCHSRSFFIFLVLTWKC
jgi:hypothetical protein